MTNINEYLRQFSDSFTAQRAKVENFEVREGEFGALSPEQTFVQFLFTGYLKDQFYLSVDKIYEAAMKVHAYYFQKYPEQYKALVKYAREKTAIKDQLLIAAYISNDVSLLNTLPPQQILKYFKWHKQFGLPMGSRGKRLVRQYLMNRSGIQQKDVEDITQHRGVMRKLIRLSHINMNDIAWEVLNTTVPTKILGQDIIAYTLRVLRTNSLDDVPAEIKIPFEVMRSNVPKDKWDFSKVTMSPYAALSMAKAIAEAHGEEAVLPFLANAKYLTSDKLFTASLHIPEKYHELQKRIAELYAARVSEQYRELLLFDAEKPIVVIQDISGSMSDNFTKSLSMIVPFAPLIKHYYMFSDSVMEYDPSMLLTLSGVQVTMDYMEENSGMTNLRGALEKALQLRKPSTIVVITDEQGNYDGERTYFGIVDKLRQKGHTIIIANPASYGAHSVAQHDGIIYLPALNADSFAASMRLLELQENKYTFNLPDA